LSQDFRRRGRTWGIFVVSTKLDTFLLYDSANCTVLHGVVLIQYRRVTDRQTDGQTDGIAVASTALAMHCGALYKRYSMLYRRIFTQRSTGSNYY